jgi:hypothetical protein
MRKLLTFGILVAAVVVGYFYRGAFGREAAIWLVLGLLGLVVVLKLIQVGVRHYVKTQEARLSPDEGRDFEAYKRRVSRGDKVT